MTAHDPAAGNLGERSPDGMFARETLTRAMEIVEQPSSP